MSFAQHLGVRATKGMFTISRMSLLVSVVCLSLAGQANAETKPAANSVDQVAETANLYGLQQVIFYGQRWIFAQNDARDTGYLFVRIAVMTGSEDEIKKINALQDQITITPMSRWVKNGGKGVPQAKAERVKGKYGVYPRMAKIADGQVEKQTAEDYFTILDLVLNDPSMTTMGDSIKESEMLADLASIGIGKGKDFRWSELDKATQDALTAGFKAGYGQVKSALKIGLVDMNGWMEVGRRCTLRVTSRSSTSSKRSRAIPMI